MQEYVYSLSCLWEFHVIYVLRIPALLQYSLSSQCCLAALASS